MCCGSNYDLPEDVKTAEQTKIDKIVAERRKQVEDQTLIQK